MNLLELAAGQNSRIWTFTRDQLAFAQLPSIPGHCGIAGPVIVFCRTIAGSMGKRFVSWNKRQNKRPMKWTHPEAARMAMTAAPQLASCLDSLLCREELGRRTTKQEYVLLLHAPGTAGWGSSRTGGFTCRSSTLRW